MAAETDPSPRETGSYGTAPEPPFRPPSLRATVGLLAVAILLGSFALPLVVNGFAAVVDTSPPTGAVAGGPDANDVASALIGQKISNASLFWLRPSLTDFAVTFGSGESPYGPTDPALVNATRAYAAAYGLGNVSAPIDLVTPSASGLDPDLTPGAATIQIPRIANATHLSQAFLLNFVMNHLHLPFLGLVGPTFVNVIELDRDLLAIVGG